MVQIVQILSLQCVLILRPAKPAANRQILRRLQKQRRTRNHRQFAAETVDHVVGADLGAPLPEMFGLALRTLLQRFQHEKESSLVRSARVSTGESHNCVHSRVLHHKLYKLFHLLVHGLEGNILRRLYLSHDAAGILLWKEAFRHLDVQVHGQASHQDRHHQCDRLVCQHPRTATL